MKSFIPDEFAAFKRYSSRTARRVKNAVRVSNILDRQGTGSSIIPTVTQLTQDTDPWKDTELTQVPTTDTSVSFPSDPSVATTVTQLTQVPTEDSPTSFSSSSSTNESSSSNSNVTCTLFEESSVSHVDELFDTTEINLSMPKKMDIKTVNQKENTH